MRSDLGTHFQLDDFYLVCDDGGFVTLVEGGIEHLNSIVVKLI